MDLQLYLRVIKRFRVIVISGLVLALLLAAMSFVRVGFDGGPSFSYRESEEWESLSTLFVTSDGFPWGSTVEPNIVEPDGKPLGPSSQYLSSLATLYVQLATTDAVLGEVAPNGDVRGKLQAFPVAADPVKGGDPLPMVTLSAIAETPEAARQLGERHSRAFVDYLERRQAEAAIPDSKRVQVEVVRGPQEPVLMAGRKLTRPIVVFLAVALCVIGLAFVLENLRPQIRPVAMAPPEPETAPRPVATRSKRRG